MIWCLHGFLGEGRDWDFLDAVAPDRVALDLFRKPQSGSMEEQAGQINAMVMSRDGAPVLAGYSMGGRLALHCLLQAPQLYRAAIIISAGLGIEDGAERRTRATHDENWARRFESEPWAEVVGAWNAQPLFEGGAEPHREESHFRRDALAHALRAWSPAAHSPLAPRLSSVRTPVLWVAGERDAKYVAAARRAVAELPGAEMWISPASGHRVPWEQPELLGERVAEFVRRHTKNRSEDSDDKLEKPSPVSGHPLRGH